jgi:hypothetical protein
MEKSIFCGRENELARLRSEWTMAVQEGQPQIVVLLADNGLGKTRLVQEFYGWLSTHVDRRGGAGYWPDELERKGDNLEVNPSLADCNPVNAAPFLWWGLRFQDVDQRNTSVAGMDASLRDLSEHLAVLMADVRNADRRRRALEALGDAGTDFALEFIQTVSHASLIKTTANLLIKSWGIGRDYFADRPQVNLTESRQREQASKAERIVKSLAAVLAARENRLPICIFVDDAHFSDADPDTTDLLRRLVEAARRDSWPLLILVTHWQDRWNADESAVARWLKPQAMRLAMLRFSTLAATALLPVLNQHMPGLLPQQASAILARADGNPQYLEEIIEFTARRPRLFEGLDARRPLKPNGLAEVLAATALGRHELNTIRFQALSPEARGALAIGSLQGQRMLQDLTAEVAHNVRLCDASAILNAIEVAEMPHNLVRRDHAWAEFLQRLYREIASQELPNNFEDPAAVQAALIAALRRRVTNIESLTELAPEDRQATLGLAWAVLRDAPDEDDASVGATAAATLIGERFARRDYMGAGRQAQALVDTIRAGKTF